jgi:hypothetical protein
VLRTVAASGIECLLLKGRSVDAWLYPDGDRLPYLDVDLLVRPGDEQAATQVLRGLGFEPRFDEDTLPDWWREHAVGWGRALDGVIVDLHHTIVGVGVDATTLWTALAADTDTVDVAGYRAPTLALPGRALLLALHAAQHGLNGARFFADLDRALERADDHVWPHAAALAAGVNASDAFAAGLRLRPAGEMVAARLGLPAGGSVEVAIRATTAPPVALGFEQLARAGGWRARAAIVRHKLVPPAAFIRHWWPPAEHSRWMLALGYAYRPLWLLRNAPRGWRAWRVARRGVRGGS